MRKIILMMSVSLDGFFEAGDRDISWHLVDDELLRALNEQFRAMGAFMFGRVTHELMAGYWPTADQDPDISADYRRVRRDLARDAQVRVLADPHAGGPERHGDSRRRA